MIEDNIILTMLPELILKMQEQKKTGPNHSLPKSFPELWKRRKELFKKLA